MIYLGSRLLVLTVDCYDNPVKSADHLSNDRVIFGNCSSMLPLRPSAARLESVSDQTDSRREHFY